MYAFLTTGSDSSLRSDDAGDAQSNSKDSGGVGDRGGESYGEIICAWTCTGDEMGVTKVLLDARTGLADVATEASSSTRKFCDKIEIIGG